MRTIRFALAVVLATACGGTAWGHGFSLGLSGNSLTANSGGSNPHLFFAQLTDIAGVLSTSHGGAGTSLFGTNKSLSFDVFTPLYFSTGADAPAQLADPNLTMQVVSQNLFGSIDITAASTFTPGYTISGNTTHEFEFNLSSTTSIPAGVYGLGYRVKGSPVGGSSYDPTELLVVTFATPTFFPGNDPLAPDSPLSRANAAIYNAAIGVPEPSSVVMAALGAVGLGVVVWRRRQRNLV